MRKSVLIVCIIAIVLLSAGIAFLMFWDEPAVADIESQQIEVGPTADLVDEMRENVVSVAFSPNEGEEFIIHHDAEDGTFELDAADPIFPGDQTSMRSLFNMATALTDVSVVTEDADDGQLEMFGLNNPDMVVAVHRDDGTTIEFEVGNIQAVGQGRFARLSGSREIFILSTHQGNMLTRTVDQMYDIGFFPFWDYLDNEAALHAIENIIIESDSGVIELRMRTLEEFLELPFGASEVQIVQPEVADANDTIVRRDILDDIVRIRPSSVETIRPSDLSVYGLDSPVRLTVAAYDWQGGTLLIGSADHDRGGRFVMIEGYDAVLFDTGGLYDFINLTFTQIRTSLLWVFSIDEVSSVTFYVEGTERDFQIDHGQEEHEALRGWLDDVELSEINARRLFMAALLLAPNGETDEPIPTGDTPTYAVTVHFLDGRSETLEFYQISETQFLIVLNGESKGLFITRMSIQSVLMRRLEILDAGEDLPAS